MHKEGPLRTDMLLPSSMERYIYRKLLGRHPLINYKLPRQAVMVPSVPPSATQDKREFAGIKITERQESLLRLQQAPLWLLLGRVSSEFKVQIYQTEFKFNELQEEEYR